MNVIWIAIIMTWNPVIYTIDKEFSSEVDCWNYYDNGAGESKMLSLYGTQVLDHQGNKPDKDYMKKHGGIDLSETLRRHKEAA